MTAPCGLQHAFVHMRVCVSVWLASWLAGAVGPWQLVCCAIDQLCCNLKCKNMKIIAHTHIHTRRETRVASLLRWQIVCLLGRSKKLQNYFNYLQVLSLINNWTYVAIDTRIGATQTTPTTPKTATTPQLHSWLTHEARTCWHTAIFWNVSSVAPLSAAALALALALALMVECLAKSAMCCLLAEKDICIHTYTPTYTSAYLEVRLCMCGVVRMKCCVPWFLRFYNKNL